MAFGDVPRVLHVAGEPDACPSPTAVVAALAPLLPRVRLVTDGINDDSVQVQVLDLGSRYRVSVAGSEREFSDDARSCEERAHAAAVFIAVAIEPPTVAVPEKAALTVTGAPSPVRRRRYPYVDLEIGGLLDAAPRTGNDNSLVSGGASIRAALGGKYLGGAVGVAGLSPVTMELGVARTRMIRIPIDLDLRASFRRKNLELIGDLGLAMAVLVLEGQGLPGGERGARLDVGIRMALGLRVWIRDRVAPFAAFHTTIFPKPYDLKIDPVGVVGTTPIVWLSGTVGLAVKIR